MAVVFVKANAMSSGTGKANAVSRMFHAQFSPCAAHSDMHMTAQGHAHRHARGAFGNAQDRIQKMHIAQ